MSLCHLPLILQSVRRSLLGSLGLCHEQHRSVLVSLSWRGTHQPSHRTKKVLDFDLFSCSYWITQERFSPKQQGQEEEAVGFGGMRSRSSSSGTSSRWYPSCSSCRLRSWVTCCGGQSRALRDGHTSTLWGVMLPAPTEPPGVRGTGEPVGTPQCLSQSPTLASAEEYPEEHLDPGSPSLRGKRKRAGQVFRMQIRGV